MRLFGAAALFGALSLFAANDEQAVRDADRTLAQASAKSDKPAVAKLLDEDFIRTDADGKTRTKAQFVQDPAVSAEPADSSVRMYGQVGVVRYTPGKINGVHIWVKRPAGWRILVSQEVSFANPPASARPGAKNCENPCKTVPYEPKDADERALLASWQALETSVANHDSTEYVRHVLDEFTMTSAAYDHPITVADRVRILDQQKKTGEGAAPAPLLSAQMYRFGDTVVMIARHQLENGKPMRNSRVWVKRDGAWRIALSQQTTIP